VGVLTEYFVARDDQDAARAQESPTGPARVGFKTAEWKSLDPVVTLAVLDEIMNGRNALEWIRGHAAQANVAGGEEDEHWVFRVADPHATMLADLPTDVGDIASQWARAEELGGFPAADLTEALRDLRDLARHARTTGQHLYCWVSL
jgi:hypothetical protein